MKTVDVTVLTPTYNRGKCLIDLYNSLKVQTDSNFQWLIIDDGSNDETEEIVKTFDSKMFFIDYKKKDNGGKHSALNYSHPYIYGKYTVIVDSDDLLEPTAIETIKRDWLKYESNNRIACVSYLRKKKNGELISNPTKETYCISNHISFRLNGRRGGDRCEVIKTDALRRYPFPQYTGEKFMSEGYLWNNLAYDYDTVYINEAIYITEYLPGGLTKSGRQLRMKSPLGMIENCKSFFYRDVNKKDQFKEMLLYWIYSFCAKRGIPESLRLSGRPFRMILCLPLGFGLYLNWKKKYLKQKA